MLTTQVSSERFSNTDGALERAQPSDQSGGITAANREIQDGLRNFADVQQRMRGSETSGLQTLQLTFGPNDAPTVPGSSTRLDNTDTPAVVQRAAEQHPFIRFDTRASEQFKGDLRDTTQRVREQMPPAVRDVLANVQVRPVRSINNDPYLGGLYDPVKNSHEINISEKGTKGGLESVLKHEFGHPFDFLSGGKKPLSDDPQFRRLVDQGIQPGSDLAKQRKGMPGSFYAEVFADLFAKNLNAPAADLSVRGADKLTAAQEWIRAKMYGR